MIRNVVVPTAELSQTQKLSQNTMLFLSMLQMNNFQLESYINDEIEQNPVIEFHMSDDSHNSVNWREYFKKQRVYDRADYGEYDPDSDTDRMESADRTDETFEDHLINQLYMMNLSESEFKISVNMIRDLNSKGYLDYTIEELSHMYNIKEKEVADILVKLKSLDPKGSFAYDMKECLVMQLDLASPDYELVRSLIENNLEDIAEHRYQEIVEQYYITDAVLDSAINKIRSLNPIPSSGFSSGYLEETDYILPEIFLTGEGDNFKIEIPDTRYTRLNVNEGYISILEGKDDEEAAEYIKKRLDRARLLLKNIESRKNTIKNVTEQIVKKQHDFIFNRGMLAPLNQSDIADILGITSSTVSRAIDNKYIDTPRGIYSLKFFFSNKSMGEDSDTSTEMIKREIKSIVDGENHEKPFSDQKIKEMLEAKEISISRRTVSKYREELEIPNSSQRKRIGKFSETKKSLQ